MPGEGVAEIEGFSGLYGRLQHEFAEQIGERPSTYGRAGRSVREEIVRCIWFGGHFPRKGLSADDGRRLELVSPGWWNVEGGPDFARGEFLLEGAGRVVGDIEVHTLASAWRGHGHHRQADYNDVALHVVMWNDTGEPAVQAEDGHAIPQLTLSRTVEDDLTELVELMDQEDEEAAAIWPAVEGKYCGRAWRAGDIEPDWLGRLLDAAGDHRILTRASTINDLFAAHPREQVLYERVAEGLGFKSNRMPFLQLAGLVPVKKLRLVIPPDVPPDSKSQMLEAIYFGLGSFLEDSGNADPETATYLAALRRTWRRLDGDLAPARLSAQHWRFAGTRPVNYPTRRIAALARLYAEHLHGGLFNHCVRAVHAARPRPRQRADVAIRKALSDVFTKVNHPYWSRRYTFGGKRLAKPRALIGAERSMILVVDVLLPILLAHAESDDAALIGRLHALWRGLPRRADNTITRRMAQAIFQTQEGARRMVNSARRQQGLHQLYGDACRSEEGCRRCVLYMAHTAGKTLTRL